MQDKYWRLAEAKALDPAAVYDGVAVRELMLRFPDGAPSGGELVIVRLRGGDPAASERLTIPLEPGEADAIDAAVEAFVGGVLARTAFIDPHATLESLPTTKPAEAAPTPPLGTL